jgi:hypothetical protein
MLTPIIYLLLITGKSQDFNGSLILGWGNNYPAVVFARGFSDAFSWYIIWYLPCIHLKNTNMKVLAGILIVTGIAMIIFRGFNIQTEKKVVDLGPIEINKKENKWIGWPTYAGAIAIAAGAVLLVANKKR